MLKDGQQYKDGFGHTHMIGGTCRHYPEWVWTIGGNWFRRSDGRQIVYKKKDGGEEYHHLPFPKASSHDLKEAL